MRQRNNDWFFILVFVLFAAAIMAANTWNIFQVCKAADVYWVSGTQYTCKWFK